MRVHLTLMLNHSIQDQCSLTLRCGEITIKVCKRGNV